MWSARRRFVGASVLGGGGAVFAGLAIWNAANYAFFLVAGRILGPADYGLVAALLAGTVALAFPAQGLQFAAARLTAAPPGGDARLADGIYRRARRRCIRASIVAAVIACALIVAAKQPWPATPAGPLLATVAVAAPLALFFLALGRLQGQERFKALSLCFVLWGVPRPVVLVPLAALGLGAYAGVGATGAAMVAAVSASIWLTDRHQPVCEPSTAQWRAFTRPLLPVVVGLSGLGLLTNLDIIVAKISLAPDVAGRFAAAAALAKAVFLVPQAISSVLLPRVAARSAAQEDTGMLIGLGVGLTLAVGSLASLAIWAIAEPLLRVTYGPDFVQSGTLLAGYTAAATLLGALIVAINHHVGRNADRFVWGVAGIAVLQALLFIAFHGSQRAVVAVDASIGVAGLLLHECMFFRTTEAIVPGLVRAIQRSRELWHAAA
jgi:O-antigen/teichoic acid export membrane protein